MPEFDRALGGGLVPGSAILMGGDPGIGKSTLLLQAAAKLANAGADVVYVSGEEAAGQVRLRAERLGHAGGADQARLGDFGARYPDHADAGLGRPTLLVIDSIQTMHSDTIEGAPGTVSQVRGCAFELIRYAKESGAALVLVGHVTKDGTIAGPRVLEHMVDVVMSFEGERSHQYRILRALKNRFGAVDEIGVFAMAGQGLEEVANPSTLFLSGREEPIAGQRGIPGARGHAAGAGRDPGADRAVAIGRHPAPRGGRLGLRAGWRCCWRCSNRAAGSISPPPKSISTSSGGYRLSDPAADLAVAAALVSALADKPLPLRSTWFGEVSLAGEVRPVAHAGLAPARSGQARVRQRGFGPQDSGRAPQGFALSMRSIACPSSLTGSWQQL